MARGVEADRIIQEIGQANNRVVTYRALASVGIGGNLITLRVARAQGHG